MGIGGGRTDCLWLHERTDRRRGARGRERHDGRGRHLLREDRQQLLLDQQRGTHNRIHINQNRTTMTNNKKQTAVEKLYLKFATCSLEEMVGNINVWFEQAKEMEKQQIIDAYHTNPLEAKWKNIGINYYNETYRGNK